MPAATLLEPSFATRVNQVLDRYHNLSDIARKVGVNESTIRKWRKGTSEPRRDHLVAFALATGVNVQWLATGVGPERGEALQEASLVKADPFTNAALLTEVIVCIEQVLQQTEKTLSPDKKAALIAWVYRVGQHEPRETLPEIAAQCVRLVSS